MIFYWETLKNNFYLEKQNGSSDGFYYLYLLPRFRQPCDQSTQYDLKNDALQKKHFKGFASIENDEQMLDSVNHAIGLALSSRWISQTQQSGGRARIRARQLAKLRAVWWGYPRVNYLFYRRSDDLLHIDFWL